MKEGKVDNPFKLILMDYSMPDCDGPTAIRLIKSYLTKKAGIPVDKHPLISVLSAYSGEDFVNTAQAAGAELYFVKPIFKP